MHKATFTRVRLFLATLLSTAVLLVLPAVAAQEITLLIHTTLYGATGGSGGLIDQFTKETGIVVNVVTAPTDQLRERAVIEYVGGTGAFDVATLQDAWMNEEVAAFLEPLQERLASAPPEFQTADLIQSLIDINTKDDDLLAIPFRGGTTMLYYRKDHLEEAGIEVPTTLEELRAAAIALTRDTDGDGVTDVYGLVQRGISGFEIVQDFGRLLFANGGAFLDAETGSCALADSAGVDTIQFWADLFQGGYMPPDLFAIGRDEQIRQVATGRASMGIYFSPYYGRLVDDLSAEQVGWGLTPTKEGVEPGRSLNTLWSLAVDRNSREKDAAWQLVLWLTNVENQITMAVEYANAPVRETTYVDPAFVTRNPLGADWLQATAASSFTPSHPRFPEMADAISIELTAALEGKKSAEAAAAAMCRQMNSLL